KTWPHHRRYGLKPLSEWLGIRFRHHDALEDAIACAKILLAAGIDQESTSLPDLEKRLRLRRGQAGSWGMKGPTTNQRKIRKVPQPAESPNHLPFLRPVDLNATSRRETSHAKPFTQHPSTGAQPEEIDWQRLMIRLELIRPLAGKGVVLQGKFQSMSESIANQLLSCSGATCHSQVNEQTDLVILGNAKSQSVEKGTTTSVGDQNRSLPSGNEMDCMGVAKSLRSSTLEYRVLNETQFIDLLQSKPDG
ncbi:DNA polymerase III subunit epsilon, partial [Rubripirellula sp.]|nr:DNA polymerase III subunit epsilon [Rubripirellula sp.]